MAKTYCTKTNDRSKLDKQDMRRAKHIMKSEILEYSADMLRFPFNGMRFGESNACGREKDGRQPNGREEESNKRLTEINYGMIRKQGK